MAGLALSLLAAFALAAPQLLPTWELKQLSQRAILAGNYDPAFGSIPPKYFSQIALPWARNSLLDNASPEVDEDEEEPPHPARMRVAISPPRATTSRGRMLDVSFVDCIAAPVTRTASPEKLVYTGALSSERHR